MYTVDNMTKGSKKLAENLRRIRLSKGMSQVEVASRLKVDKSFISNMENAKNNPTLSTLEKLAILLEVPLCDLLN